MIYVAFSKYKLFIIFTVKVLSLCVILMYWGIYIYAMFLVIKRKGDSVELRDLASESGIVTLSSVELK